MPDWLWQNLASTAVWEVLFVIGGAATLGLVKRKWPTYAPTVGYAALGATCVAIIIFTFTGRPLLSRSQQVQTNADNVEENVKTWATTLGMGTQAIPVPDMYFALKITLTNGNAMIVGRGSKEKTGYLQFQVVMIPSAEHQAAIARLTKDQADMVTQEVILELARSKIGYSLIGPDSGHLMQTVILMKAVPLADLTEASFAATLNEVDSAMSLVRAALTVSLERVAMPHALQQ